jgi:uncharacterized protein (DUF433 family)
MQITEIDLSEYIERRYFQERPHVRGRRIPVIVIVEAAYDGGRTISEMMQDYSLSESEVLAALLYYTEHKAEIEALEAEYRAVPVEMWVEHGDNALLFRRDDAARRGE